MSFRWIKNRQPRSSDVRGFGTGRRRGGRDRLDHRGADRAGRRGTGRLRRGSAARDVRRFRRLGATGQRAGAGGALRAAGGSGAAVRRDHGRDGPGGVRRRGRCRGVRRRLGAGPAPGRGTGGAGGADRAGDAAPGGDRVAAALARLAGARAADRGRGRRERGAAGLRQGLGVPLVDAVAASCAVPGVWPPVGIDGRQYVDGGVRSMANLDFVEDVDRVVVIVPMGMTEPFPSERPVEGSVRELRARGCEVVVVAPDEAARAAIGDNPLDPGTRGPAAEAGRAQGRALRLPWHHG
ncbi:patatin-like phospholipase family protein [Streptomyces sp. DHE7-1]|nr:patatin-like phospholipase family protein [Streptomyces sp. DHE7-1]